MLCKYSVRKKIHSKHSLSLTDTHHAFWWETLNVTHFGLFTRYCKHPWTGSEYHLKPAQCQKIIKTPDSVRIKMTSAGISSPNKKNAGEVDSNRAPSIHIQVPHCLYTFYGTEWIQAIGIFVPSFLRDSISYLFFFHRSTHHMVIWKEMAAN